MVVTGAMMFTPTVEIGFMLYEKSIHVTITARAAHAIGRLAKASRCVFRTRHTRLPRGISTLPILKKRRDKIIKCFNFTKNFRAYILSRDMWKSNGKLLIQGEI